MRKKTKAKPGRAPGPPPPPTLPPGFKARIKARQKELMDRWKGLIHISEEDFPVTQDLAWWQSHAEAARELIADKADFLPDRRLLDFLQYCSRRIQVLSKELCLTPLSRSTYISEMRKSGYHIPPPEGQEPQYAGCNTPPSGIEYSDDENDETTVDIEAETVDCPSG